jgi:hypothetical protein
MKSWNINTGCQEDACSPILRISAVFNVRCGNCQFAAAQFAQAPDEKSEVLPAKIDGATVRQNMQGFQRKPSANSRFAEPLRAHHFMLIAGQPSRPWQVTGHTYTSC